MMSTQKIFLDKRRKNKMFKFLKSKKQRALKAEIERHNSQTREKMRDGSVATVAQARDYVNAELGLTISTWHETWTKQANWNN